MRVRSGYLDATWPGIIVMPMSAMLRIGAASNGGTSACMPGRGASVPRTEPLRVKFCANTV